MQAAFFKPNRIKLVFLGEWALFILFSTMRGDLETGNQVLVALPPFIFFYLVACGFYSLSQCFNQVASSWWLLGCAVFLTVVDQTIKLIVTVSIPAQASIPILKDWLYLAHERNFHGSWIASVLNGQLTDLIYRLQVGLAILVPPFSILSHRYYITRYRKSVWVDIALLGIVAGYVCWVLDILMRGYIVDFIHLPDLVTADLKDIFIAIGVAAFFAELLENPAFPQRRENWQKERDKLAQSITDLYTFLNRELRYIWGVIESTIRR